MKRMGSKKYIVNLIFTITLLGLFALSALSVAVLGAQVYARSVDKLDENYGTRTSLVYISEKIRQCPQRDMRIDSIQGQDSLVLNQEIDGQSYESWIFANEGKLKEVLVKKGTNVKLIDGEEIMDLKSFTIVEKGGMIKLTVENKFGKSNSLILEQKY